MRPKSKLKIQWKLVSYFVNDCKGVALCEHASTLPTPVLNEFLRYHGFDAIDERGSATVDSATLQQLPTKQQPIDTLKQQLSTSISENCLPYEYARKPQTMRAWRVATDKKLPAS